MAQHIFGDHRFRMLTVTEAYFEKKKSGKNIECPERFDLFELLRWLKTSQLHIRADS